MTYTESKNDTAKKKDRKTSSLQPEEEYKGQKPPKQLSS